MTQICNSCMKNKKCLYTKYIFNKINIDDIDHTFEKYLNIHNQKFVFYYINCQFVIHFKNIIFATIQINNHLNTDCINIRNYLLFYIDSCRYGEFIFDNIFIMEINTISCRCNMTYKYFLNNPMSMLERRINYIISRNPYLINYLIVIKIILLLEIILIYCFNNL